jgi:hypothetical protein
MRLLFSSFLTIAAALPALAALGDTVSQAGAYSVHQLTLENGTVVNEYVSAAGKVFGVAWNGPAIPDLSQLYGTYFEQYRTNVPKRARRMAAVRSGDLVAEASGHPLSYMGRAYVTSLLPVGVGPEVIQ